MAGSHTAWDVLGLAPTTDVGAIRRAYAQQLKRTRPEDDPEAFQALLAARDKVLAEARRDQAGINGLDNGEATMPPAVAAEMTGGALPEHRVIKTRNARADPPDRAVERPTVSEIQDLPSRTRTAPVVVETAPLEPQADHWAVAARLAADIPTLDGDLSNQAETWLEAVAKLPSEPRREVEATVLTTLMRAWRVPESDRLDAKAVVRTRPIIGRLGPIFGWPRQDGVLGSALPSLDAAVAAHILRELLPPDLADPSLAVVRTGLRSRTVLQIADARAFLARVPHAMDAFDALRRRERVPRRLDRFALVAPHIWATRHRRWFVALVSLSTLWIAALVAAIAVQTAGLAGGILAAAAVVLYTAPAVLVSIQTRQILVGAAARAAQSASRRGLYVPAARQARLSRAGTPLRRWIWLPLCFCASALLLGPYAGLLSLLTLAIRK